jgi:hypothetical protein
MLKVVASAMDIVITNPGNKDVQKNGNCTNTTPRNEQQHVTACSIFWMMLA